MEERINENEILNSQIKKIDKCIYKVSRSICKIIIDNIIGSGFLIKLIKGNKDIYCLMTNEHIIKKEYINNKKIEIYYDNEYK